MMKNEIPIVVSYYFPSPMDFEQIEVWFCERFGEDAGLPALFMYDHVDVIIGYATL